MASGGSVTMRRGEPKMCEGAIEWKNSNQYASSWQKIWLVLKGNVIYVFNDQRTTQGNQMGNLTIDANTTFVNLKGDTKKGFKFELKAGTRLNKFKTQRSSEREQWRAYVLGLSTGRVPDSIDLLPRDKKEIQSKIDSYQNGSSFNHRASIISELSTESGIGDDVRSNFSGSKMYSKGSSGSGSTGSPSRTSNPDWDRGGPIMVHRFYADRSDQQVPSWFFSKCSRHSAETILINNRNYGNTLIRESSTHKDNGSYVISKSFFSESTQHYEVEHYEVTRVANGYRINVENDQPEMLYLSAVMKFFVSTTGGSAKPMTTNDPVTLNLREPEYQTTRIRESPADPWTWPPPDYDADDRRPARHSDHRTVTPRSMESQRQEYHRQAQSPGGPRWSSGGGPKQPATVAAFPRRESSRQNTRLDDVQHRVRQNETLRDLEDAINTGFDEPYMNADAIDQLRQSQEAPPLPPPAAHRYPSSSYVNQGEDNHHDSNVPPPPLPHRHTQQQGYINAPEKEEIRSLPAAPPIPSYRNNRNSAAESPPKHAHTIPSPPQPPPAPPAPPVAPAAPPSVQPTSPNAQAGHQHQPTHSNVHHSPSDPALKTTKAAPPKVLQKSKSELPFKHAPNSPTSFPTWTEPKSVLKRVSNQNGQSQNSSAATSEDSGSIAGIDDTNPGGVSDLKSRFEKRPVSMQGPTSPTAKSSPGSTPGRARSTSLSDSQPGSGLRHSASYNAPTNTKDHVPTNTPDLTSSARQREDTKGTAQFSNDDALYDDTANIDPNLLTGLSEEFKRKLEVTIGGSNTMPNRPKSMPASPGHQGHHAQESEYEELPEIVPDSVTYVNDTFNT